MSRPLHLMKDFHYTFSELDILLITLTLMDMYHIISDNNSDKVGTKHIRCISALIWSLQQSLRLKADL